MNEKPGQINQQNKRISKDEYYLGIAREVSRRSTCFRRAIGAIIVRDDQIISTGYVGAPRKTKDSLEHGFCLRDQLNIPHGQRYELCRSVHAEQNAIINAARAGVSLLGGDMFIFGSEPARDMSSAARSMPSRMPLSMRPGPGSACWGAICSFLAASQKPASPLMPSPALSVRR